jgi:Protein of unknown function (DUF1761)
MGIWSVALAAIAAFAAASAWYMALAKRWVAATGKSEAELRAAGAAQPMAIAFLGYLLTAATLRHILHSSGVTGFLACLVSGLGVGLFIAAPFILTNYAFARQPRALWWIDVGHAVLACTAIGAVLGLAA